jgi:WD40 repeat protein
MTDPTSPTDPAREVWLLWRRGPRPDVRRLLDRDEGLTPAQVAAALRVDQQERWGIGDRVPAADYLLDFPTIRGDPEAALEIIYGEVLIREQLGEAPTPEEYLRAYPEYAEPLRDLIELHRALGATPVCDSNAATMGPSAIPPRRPPGRAVGDPASRAFMPSLAGYEIVEELGRGGMGVVYRARQVRLNRAVALKMILAGDLAGPEARVRFLQEAEVVARLHHPHIVQVYAIGDYGRHPYIEMEYVAGGSLADRLDGSPWQARDAVRLIETLARALHEAHRLGIVHRDLKPANVLLATDGTPKVADFGLAKLLDGGSGLTQSNHVLGSPSYMAPEQAGGRAREVGPAADVYALGAVLYELLTGRPPFRAATELETLEQVRSAEPVPPGRLEPGLPRDVETIALKCLEKEPTKRYATAADLAEDLRRFGASEPIRARPAGGAERVWRWCRRRPALAALAAAVVLLLAVLAFGAPLAVLSLRRERDLARAAEQLAREKLWQASLFGARASRLGGQAGQRFESLSLLAQAAKIRKEPTLRDEAIACLALADLRILSEWQGPVRPDSAVSFDAGLELYARVDEGSVTVRRVDGTGGILRLPAPESGGPPDIYLSPDGRFLAVTHYTADGRRLGHRVWSLPAGKLVLDVPTDEAGARLAFSHDGRRLAAGCLDHRLGLYDLSTFRAVGALERLPDLDYVAFHPGGKLLAVSGAVDRVVEVRDVDTGAVLATLPHPRGRVNALAWSGNGATLATGCDDHGTYLWDTATYRLRAVLNGHNAAVFFVAFHPSDHLLASASHDGTTRLWDLATGQTLVTAQGTAVQFSRDGTRLAFSNHPLDGIWEVAFGDCFRLLHPRWTATPPPGDGPPGNVRADIDPDGRLLASAGLEGVRVWDLSSAHEVAHLPLGFSGSALFHPRDGSLITYGTGGLRHWPIGNGHDGVAGTLPIGPPRVLEPSCTSQSYHASLGRNGDLVVLGDRPNGQAVVLDVGRPEERWRLEGQPGINSVTLSPDGRWVAAGSWLGPEVKVWDRATGQSQTLMPDSNPGGANACVAFSPDGKWLVTGGQSEYRFWQPGPWRLGRTIPRDRREEMPGLIAFSRDGRSMAITSSQRTIRLIETATGRALANLSAPDRRVIQGLCFGPDDSRLAVATNDRAVQIWDMGQIRQHLATIGLDWDLAPHSSPPD